MHRCVLSWAIGLFAGWLGLTLQSSSTAGADRHQWLGSQQFVQICPISRLNLNVVPAREDGNIGNAAYLTEDPAANWLTFQMKTRSLTCLEQWQGTVWVEALLYAAPSNGMSRSGSKRPARSERFVLFGDAGLIDRIVKTLKR